MRGLHAHAAVLTSALMLLGPTPAPAQDPAFELIALDRATGAIRWTKTLRVEQPREGRHPTNTFASASPSTDGEHIIAFFGSHGLYALTMTGDLVWEKHLGDMDTRNG